jgi:hypothetical protein
MKVNLLELQTPRIAPRSSNIRTPQNSVQQIKNQYNHYMKTSIILPPSSVLLVALAALGLTVPVLAQETKPAKPQMLTREDHMLLSITGIIQDIDYAKREVSLKGPGGHVETFSVDEKVKRLNEAKVGDAVTVDYYLGFAAELRKLTPEEEKNPLMVLDAAGKAGEKSAPAAGAMRSIKAVCTIEGLDRPTQTVTVKGPRGKYYVARVADPSRLEQARIGETLVMTFTEAAAVSLKKAEKKKAQ